MHGRNFGSIALNSRIISPLIIKNSSTSVGTVCSIDYKFAGTKACPETVLRGENFREKGDKSALLNSVTLRLGRKQQCFTNSNAFFPLSPSPSLSLFLFFFLFLPSRRCFKRRDAVPPSFISINTHASRFYTA